MSSVHSLDQTLPNCADNPPGQKSSEIVAENTFDTCAKHPTTENLQQWKKAILVLFAARRFQYPAELEDKMFDTTRKFRASVHAIIAVYRLLHIGELIHFGFGDLKEKSDKLMKLMQDRQLDLLTELGGVKGVAHYLLGTNLTKGILDDSQEVEKRKEAFGSNTYPRKPPKHYFAFLWDACKDLTLIILIVCAMLSMGLGIKSHGIKEGWYDGGSIAVAVFLVILVTSISDYRQSLQFLALSDEKRNIKVQVKRGGRRQEISIFQVVYGDIVCLSTGDQVPADGLFIDGCSLSLDESSMTGESEPVHVYRKWPFLLSGSKVHDGHGCMLVTGVGMRTEWGKLMAANDEENGEETPLQVRLNGVASFIGYVGTSVAVLVFVILLIFYFSGHTEGSKNSGKFKAGQTSSSDVGNSLIDILVVAVTIVVVAVPEGLPLAVTLTLAYAMKKMIADKALVRRLSACETMGSATTVCSDKTGTLTLNQMNVVKVWAAGELREPGLELQNFENFYSLLAEGIAQNSSGSVFIPSQGEAEVLGSPTEKAVLLWGLKLGIDFKSVRQQSTVLQVETFNSDKKRAGVAVQVSATKRVNAHWKGAAELIVEDCDQLLCLDGADSPITADEKYRLMHVIEGMAAESLRCIALAYREVDVRDVPTKEHLEKWKVPEGSLTLLAILGIKDPCRPEVYDAVQQCQVSGIKVRMITGDNIVTAKAIAVECGILHGGVAIEGVTFRNYTPEMRRQEVSRIVVMARSSPSDKLLMVRVLRELGEVVAVTGDGTNDAPALREADIGLAMGIQGTEVAKESSDILILDDNFVSVVRVVRWGRSVYINIQKFIQFQLTVNVAALTVNFVAAVSSGDVPLTAVQLLWVNLIMDTLGALALATERPTDELLQRAPVGRKEPIISNLMWRNILLQAAYQVIVLLILQFRGKSLLKLRGADADDIKNTVIFNAFVFCQLFNEVNARKIEEKNVFRGLLTNWLFLGILVFSVLFQVIIVEFLNKFASTVKLEWKYWVISIAIGSLSWPLSFLIKFIPVPRKPLLSLTMRPFRSRRRRRRQEAITEEAEDLGRRRSSNAERERFLNPLEGRGLGGAG